MTEQTKIQAEAVRDAVRRLGVPAREEVLSGGSRLLSWMVGTRTLRYEIHTDGTTERV